MVTVLYGIQRSYKSILDKEQIESHRHLKGKVNGNDLHEFQSNLSQISLQNYFALRSPEYGAILYE